MTDPEDHFTRLGEQLAAEVQAAAETLIAGAPPSGPARAAAIREAWDQAEEAVLYDRIYASEADRDPPIGPTGGWEDPSPV